MDHPTSRTSQEAAQVTRRSFLQLTFGWLAGLFAVAASAAGAVRFLVPNVLFEPSEVFKAGKPGITPTGPSPSWRMSGYSLFAREIPTAVSQPFALISDARLIIPVPDTIAPATGSVFDEQGKVKGGPAPRALDWFQVTLSKDNRLLVDKSHRVPADKYLVLQTVA